MNQRSKYFKNQDYEIFFDTSTGLEIMRGVGGKPDPFKLELPSLLDIGIMGHCDNKCAFCYQGHNDQPNMKLEDFKTIIDQVKHHTNQVALGGRGDPNLHENFKEIVEYARENNVIPNYTTSGFGLKDEHIEISKMCGAVAVSEYRTKETYSSIKRFMDAKIKTNIHMIFSNANFNDSIKILRGFDPWKRKNGDPGRVDIDRLNAVIFLLFKPAGAGRNVPGMKPNQYQLGVFSEYIFKSDAKFKVGMDSCLVNHVLQRVEPKGIQALSIDTCEGGRMSGYITPDMKMKPCSFADSSWEIPITAKHDIDYIWNRSQKFKSFRSKLRKKRTNCPIGL
jgi:MoaA/NifB/PqqE/SkfB family radical SAM enzyme